MCLIEKFELNRGKRINLEDINNRKIIFYENRVMFSLENGCVYNITFSNVYKLDLLFIVKDIEYCTYGLFILSETGQLYIYSFIDMSLSLFIDNVVSNIKNARRVVESNGKLICMNYVKTKHGDILFRDICDVKIHLSKSFENILCLDHNDNFIVLLEPDYTVKLIDIRYDVILNSNISNEVPEKFTNYGIKLDQGLVLVNFITPNGVKTISVKFK